jgi:hypothetical protein
MLVRVGGWRSRETGGSVAGVVGLPQFPGIAVWSGEMFLVTDSLAPLEMTSEAALRSGSFARLYLFDSQGLRWPVAGVERTGERPQGPFGKAIGIRLIWAPPQRPLLSEVAEALCVIVAADPDDIYNQFMTHEQLMALFRSAATPHDLIAAAASRGET